MATSERAETGWSDVERAARAGLVQVESDVRAREPSAKALQRSVRAGAAKLFAYCALSLPSRATAEAIVAGITVRTKDAGYLVEADVCGEDSGRVFFDESIQLMSVDRAVLIETVSKVAERLSRRSGEILGALRQSEEA
jgi:hypothetical protein